MTIDTNFNFHSDARGGDPDSTSLTLKRYHKTLWSKLLPNGKVLKLEDNQNGVYLYHSSDLGEFILGSDAITHSYKNQRRKQWLTSQILSEVDELFNIGSTIGAYIIFPKNKIDNKFTINQARGVNSFIDDRFDLTLECIRLFYLRYKSPLFDTLLRYKNFFDLFSDFEGYVHFFLLDDLVDENYKVKFYLPFDGFRSKPIFSNIDEYLIYKDRVMKFVKSRNERIERFVNQTNGKIEMPTRDKL